MVVKQGGRHQPWYLGDPKTPWSHRRPFVLLGKVTSQQHRARKAQPRGPGTSQDCFWHFDMKCQQEFQAFFLRQRFRKLQQWECLHLQQMYPRKNHKWHLSVQPKIFLDDWTQILKQGTELKFQDSPGRWGSLPTDLHSLCSPRRPNPQKAHPYCCNWTPAAASLTSCPHLLWILHTISSWPLPTAFHCWVLAPNAGGTLLAQPQATPGRLPVVLLCSLCSPRRPNP